jgi:hypothetical protein
MNNEQVKAVLPTFNAFHPLGRNPRQNMTMFKKRPT